MKTAINSQNKAAFLAQYQAEGQDFVTLKSIQHLEKEDAIEILDIIYPKRMAKFRERERGNPFLSISRKDGYISISAGEISAEITIYNDGDFMSKPKKAKQFLENYITVFDYLRLRKYAVRWRGLIVAELEIAGWARIDDNPSLEILTRSGLA